METTKVIVICTTIFLCISVITGGIVGYSLLHTGTGNLSGSYYDEIREDIKFINEQITEIMIDLDSVKNRIKYQR